MSLDALEALVARLAGENAALQAALQVVIASSPQCKELAKTLAYVGS